MSRKVGLPEKLASSTDSDHARTAIYLTIILLVVILISEIITIFVLKFFQAPNNQVNMLGDAVVFIMLIFPSLYFLYFRPLWKHIDEKVKVEKNLRSNEELLKKVLDILPVGIWIIDSKGKYIQSNQVGENIWAGKRFLDQPRDGEYNGWWADTGEKLQPDEWPPARALARKETDLNKVIIIEAYDGKKKTILCSAVPILDDKNNLQGAVVVNQDITLQTNAQRALEESEQLFRTAMESLPVGVWLTDGTGKIIFGNTAGQAIWRGARYVGIEQYREYKGWWLNTGKLIEPDEWAVARAIKNGESSLNEEIEIECFDGSHKIILNSAVPIRDDQGCILRAFIVNQDITLRKEREREILQANELMERYFSSISTHIAYMDRDFNFIRVNDAYAKAAGHSPEFFVGKNHFQLYPHEENQMIFQKVIDTGEPFYMTEKPFEYAEFPERGTTYWDLGLQPVKQANGIVEGLVMSLVDVTAGKRAQVELKQKNQELQELSNVERRHRELAENLAQALIVINSSLDQKQVLNGILEQIRKTIPCTGANLLLSDGENIQIASFLGFENMPEGTIKVGNVFPLKGFPLHKRIIEARQPTKIDSTKDYPEWHFESGFEWINSYLGVPLIFNKQVIGIISLLDGRKNAFSQEALDHLQAFAVPAALALNNARMFKEESTARQVAETLAAASRALTKTLDLEKVINTLLDHIHMIISSDTAGVTLLEEEVHVALRALKGYGLLADRESNHSLLNEAMLDSFIHRIASARKNLSFSTPTSYTIQEEQSGCDSICSGLIIPIIANDKLIGLVELGRTGFDEFNPEQVRWVEALVGQAAMAIQNAWLFREVRSSSERLQSLTRKLVEIQENERYWVARELHDEAGQALSILKLHLGLVAQDPDCTENIRSKMDDLKGRTDSVLEELHRLAMDLRPIALDHLGLVAALEQFAKNLNSDRLVVQFKALGLSEERLPKDLETSLYRIVQEALANVIRHAQACNVGILLKQDEKKVKLFVEDDGIGFDPDLIENTPRLGLIGMRERAEMFGGTLTIESLPGKGSSIIVEVPYVNSHINS